MQDDDSISDSGQWSGGEWEQQGQHRGSAVPQSPSNEDAEGRKGSKKDLAHVPCRFFRVGACTAGSACPFSHVPKEPGQGKIPCKWFQKGSCRFGHKCANAHILPGQPPSMDWKNKKAAKAAAQAEAGQGQPPTPQSAAFPPSSSGSYPSAAPSLQQVVPQSGLSSMFGRSASTTHGPPPPGLAGQEDPAMDSVLLADSAVAAIGMSPIGLPLPADLPMPATSGGTGRPSIASSTKPVSYASAAAKMSASPSGLGNKMPSSPAVAGASSLASPPPSGAGLISNQRPYSSRPSNINGNSLSPTSAVLSPSNLSPARLSSSVPSTFPVFEGSQYTEQSSPLHPHSPRAPSALSQASHVAAQHSPLAAPLPPGLYQSHSYSNALPSRSSLLHSTSPSTPTSLGHHPPGIVPPTQRSTSSANVFGTSPFGNNAIFLSSSHEEDKDAFISRASRAPGAGREMSPARASVGYDIDSGMRRGSYESRGFYSNGNGARFNGSSALVNANGGNGLENDEEDDGLQEEELVPSSLKHLLTPDERARKDSRSSGAGGRSGFFNPFDDDVEEDDLPGGEGGTTRYSKSVPAASHYQQQQQMQQQVNQQATAYNRAPGSPTSFLSSYFSPTQASAGNGNNGLSASPNTSNLAKHLLAGGGGGSGQPKVERGFYSSSFVPNSGVGNGGGLPSPSSLSGLAPLSGTGNVSNASGSGLRPVLNNINLGTSLPQGLAAGLSRLHLIPAGAERTGYTPPSSTYAASPPPSAPLTAASGITSSAHHHHHLSSSANNPTAFPSSPPSANGMNPNASAFGGPGTSRPTSSFKLPTLGSLGGGLGGLSGLGAGRRVSSNHLDLGVPHVGSPLARNEIHGYVGSGGGKDRERERERDGKIGEASNGDEEEDEMLFDMDV